MILTFMLKISILEITFSYECLCNFYQRVLKRNFLIILANLYIDIINVREYQRGNTNGQSRETGNMYIRYTR